MGICFHLLVRILFLLWTPARGQLRCSPTTLMESECLLFVPLHNVISLVYTPIVLAAGAALSVDGLGQDSHDNSRPSDVRIECCGHRQQLLHALCLIPSISIMPLTRTIIPLASMHPSLFRRMACLSPLKSIAIAKVIANELPM